MDQGRVPEAGLLRLVTPALERERMGHPRIAAVGVVLDDHEASAQAYFLYYSNVSTAPTLTSIGHYADTFRHTDDGWKLARREIVIG